MRIDNLQYAQLEIASRSKFIDRLVNEAKEEFSSFTKRFSDDDLKVQINNHINRALLYGIVNENYIALFISWNWKFGDQFESKSSMKKVNYILTSKSLTTEQKLKQILNALSEISAS